MSESLAIDLPAPAAMTSPVPAVSFRSATLAEHAVSAGLWGLGIAFAVPVLPSIAIGCAVVGPDKMSRLQRAYAHWQLRLTGSKWQATVHPKVDPTRAYMFAQNHTNHFDFVFMNNATPHYKQGVELESHFKIPVYGWFMKARGGIPVKRGVKGQSPEVMAHMRREIDKGHAILVFPEGTRTLDGRVGRFRTGSFFIARDLGLPICPVAATGAFDMMRKGSFVLRPGHTISIFVDEPVETAGLPDSAIPELAQHVQSVVARRVDEYWRERGWQGA